MSLRTKEYESEGQACLRPEVQFVLDLVWCGGLTTKQASTLKNQHSVVIPEVTIIVIEEHYDREVILMWSKNQ